MSENDNSSAELNCYRNSHLITAPMDRVIVTYPKTENENLGQKAKNRDEIIPVLLYDDRKLKNHAFYCSNTALQAFT